MKRLIALLLLLLALIAFVVWYVTRTRCCGGGGTPVPAATMVLPDPALRTELKAVLASSKS